MISDNANTGKKICLRIGDAPDTTGEATSLVGFQYQTDDPKQTGLRFKKLDYIFLGNKEKRMKSQKVRQIHLLLMKSATHSEKKQPQETVGANYWEK